MLNYYKKSMNTAHGLWQKALDDNESKKADGYMADYEHYKELHDNITVQ